MEFSGVTILFFLLAFLSEAIGTVSGFGSSVFFVPLVGMIYDFKTSLALTGILHIFSTAAQLFMFRKELDWGLMLKIGIPSVLFVLLGANLSDVIDLKFAELAMGIFLILFALIFLRKKDLKIKPSTFLAISGGVISGFLAGIIGTGGAVRGATLSAFDLPKGVFVGTSAGIDFAVDFSRTYVYLTNGYLRKEFLWYVPVLMVLAYLGAFFGKKILNFIPQEIFKKIVLTIILIVGSSMVYGFFTNKQFIN